VNDELPEPQVARAGWRLSNIKYISEGLVARGYSDAEVLKILGGNWLRYFETIWGE